MFLHNGDDMKNKTVKIALWVAGIVLLILLVFVGVFFYYTSKLDIKVLDSGDDKGYFSLLKDTEGDDEVTNILLIGADNDVGSGMDSLGNADGLVIVSINNENKQITLTSLMRDIRVLKSNGYATKLTIAYHEGGPELLIECIESNLEIDIDNYVLLTYPDIVKIIDAAGGVEMELYEEEIYHMREKIEAVSKTVGEYWEPHMIPLDQVGVNKLNGIQAAAFMRVRMAGNGDYERTERARRVLLGLKDNVDRMNLVELAGFADVVLPCITTDITQDDIARHIVRLNKYMAYDFVSNRIPVDGSFSYSNDMNGYTIIKYDINRDHFYETVYTEKQRAELFPPEEEE